MKIDAEAAKHLAEIDKARKQAAELLREIRKHQKKLLQIVVKAFNEESEPIDGMTVEGREVVLGYKACAESPIGVCAYCDRVVGLPAQREPAKYPARDDACLFCGVVMPESESDGRHLQAP